MNDGFGGSGGAPETCAKVAESMTYDSRNHQGAWHCIKFKGKQRQRH